MAKLIGTFKSIGVDYQRIEKKKRLRKKKNEMRFVWLAGEKCTNRMMCTHAGRRTIGKQIENWMICTCCYSLNAFLSHGKSNIVVAVGSSCKNEN